MSLSTFRYSWKIFTKLSAPIRGLIKNILIVLIVEFIKFCAALFLTFGFGYLIFYFVDTNSLQPDINSQRLSAGLLENDSFSKFPFVIELPPKPSTESVKQYSNTHYTKMQKLKELVAQSTSKSHLN